MTKLPVSDRPYWTLPEAVACIVFGDPTQPLPDRGVCTDEVALAEVEACDFDEPYARPDVIVAHPELSEQVDQIIKAACQFPELGGVVLSFAKRRRDLKRLLEQGEAALAAAIMGGEIIAYGKRAPAPFQHPTDDTRYSEIAKVDLLCNVVIGGPLCPPGESWLVTVDDRGQVDHAWQGVRVLADKVRSLFPNPLVAAINSAGAGARIAATKGAETRMVTWLAEEMRRAPFNPRGKAAMQIAATKQGLARVSRKAFERAWSEAVGISGASRWSAPGRRKQIVTSEITPPI
jgi:hypothetical protein